MIPSCHFAGSIQGVQKFFGQVYPRIIKSVVTSDFFQQVMMPDGYYS